MPKTSSLYESLCAVLPAGVNSPVRSFRGFLDEPLIAARGEGSHIYDVKGQGYIDYCMSWGALLHGHAHPEINQAAIEKIHMGSSFGLTTEIEGDLARKIVTMIPSVELIRFVSSGTEATMTAIRLARGFTGRTKIIKFIGNYHGHSDCLLVKGGSGMAGVFEASSAGVPQEFVKNTLCLPFNDCEEFRSAMNSDIACVIVEAVAGNMGCVPASQSFIETLRKECDKWGALLIFDDVMAGFRIHKQGSEGFYQIQPDLTCFGKIVGGGFNVAAFGGKRAIMEHIAPLGNVYQAGTLSGNPVSMAAGLKALDLLDRPGFYEELEDKSACLTDPLIDWIKKRGAPVVLHRALGMFSLFFGVTHIDNFGDVQKSDHECYKRLFRALLKEGIYIPPSSYEAWFMSMAHSSDDLTITSQAIIKFLESEYN